MSLARHAVQLFVVVDVYLNVITDTFTVFMSSLLGMGMGYIGFVESLRGFDGFDDGPEDGALHILRVILQAVNIARGHVERVPLLQ